MPPFYDMMSPGDPASSGASASPSMADAIMQYIRGQAMQSPGMATQGAAPPQRPMQGMPPLTPSASSRGLLSNAKQGVDIGTIMKLVKAYYTGGASLLGEGAAQQAGAAGGADAGGGTGGGIMSMLGGLGGIFGGKKKTAPTPALTPAPQAPPLIPRSADMWQTRQPPTLFG